MAASKNPRGVPRPQDGRGAGQGQKGGQRGGRNIQPCPKDGPKPPIPMHNPAAINAATLTQLTPSIMKTPCIGKFFVFIDNSMLIFLVNFRKGFYRFISVSTNFLT